MLLGAQRRRGFDDGVCVFQPQFGQLGGVAVVLEEPGGQCRDDGCGEMGVEAGNHRQPFHHVSIM